MNQDDANQTNEQPDLTGMYKDILEKYSQNLAAQAANLEPVKSEPVQGPPDPPPIDNPPAVTEDKLQNPAPVDEATSTPPPIDPPLTPPRPDFSLPQETPPGASALTDPDPAQGPKKPSSFFKLLFFISLFIFLGVAAAIGYAFFLAPRPEVSLTLDDLDNVTPALSPTPSGPVCELNDKVYPVGETFTATDSCNQCTCNEDLTISCTDNVCPTGTTSTVPSDWKTYSSSKDSFSFKYPISATVTATNYTGYDSTYDIKKIVNDDTTVIILYIGSKDESVTYSEAKQITYAGITGVSVSLPKGQNPPSEHFFFKNGDKYYRFVLSWDGTNQSSVEIFNQILSTFKLTN